MSARRVRPGRPPLPEGEAKTVTFCIRMTAEEREALRRAAGREGLRDSEWARSALVSASWPTK